MTLHQAACALAYLRTLPTASEWFTRVDKQFADPRGEMNTRFTKIENQLRSVENYKVLQLIKILREKKILTKQDAATLGIA